MRSSWLFLLPALLLAAPFALAQPAAPAPTYTPPSTWGSAAPAPPPPPEAPPSAPSAAPAPASPPAASVPAPSSSSPPPPPFVEHAPAPEAPLPQQLFYRRAPPSPPSAFVSSGLLGFEAEIRGGAMVPDASSPVIAPNFYPVSQGGQAATGDILGNRYQPYGYDPFALSATVGYRFFPFLSAGVFFDYANFNVNGGTDTGDYNDAFGGSTVALEREVWQLGVYARYYLTTLSTHLHPWVELGVGYSDDTASYTHGGAQNQGGGQPLTIDYYLTAQGLATNLRVGLDWRLAPVFAIGPMLGYGHVFTVSSCADGEPQYDSLYGASQGTPVSQKTCSNPPVQGQDYNLWFVGIFAKVTLGPDVESTPP